MSDSPSGLESLLGVVSATIDDRGSVVSANAGFARLAGLDGSRAAGARVDRLFIQPDFATIAHAPPDADGRVYQGMLTFGEFTGHTRTLHACLWRDGARLRLLAEYDIEGLERLSSTVLELNRDYARTQAELAQANVKLQAANTRLQETQKKLVEAEKMASLGVLVAGVAHEINTPVGIGMLAVSTLHDQSVELAQRLSARSLTAADLAKFLDRAGTSTDLIRRNLERIGRLVEAFGQVAVEGKPLRKSPIRMLEFVRDVVRSLGDRLPGDRVAVRIDCADDLVIDGDPADWASIFTHLFDNSVRHGLKERDLGTIEVAIARDGDRLRIDYRDDGAGMSPQTRARVFDPFFTTNLQQSMGLGMHLVYNLVTHRLGGGIRCESEPGRGVRFHIDVPL